MKRRRSVNKVLGMAKAGKRRLITFAKKDPRAFYKGVADLMLTEKIKS